MKNIESGNKSVLRKLSVSFYKKNRWRNRLLLAATVLSVTFFIVIFGFTNGKIDADEIRIIRETGATTSTYLESATEKEEQKIKQLPYVSETGRKNRAGFLVKDDRKLCDCIFLDDYVYNNMISPSLSDIVGAYPQNAFEIMISVDTLAEIGITEPQVGMKIPLDFYWYGMNSVNTGRKTFILSGYFKNYVSDVAGMQEAYISQEILDKSGIAPYPFQLLIGINNKFMSSEQIETALYRDVELLRADQLFVSIDSAAYRAAAGIFGDYAVAVLYCTFVLFSLFLLTYNIISLSMTQEIQQYGLLEVIGTTDKQIKIIFFQQYIKNAFYGVSGGIIMGSIVTHIFLPSLLKKIYLEGSEPFVDIHVLSIKLIIAATIFSLISLFLAIETVFNRLFALTPLEALYYMEVNTYVSGRKKGIRINFKGKGMSFICRMANRNIWRFKRKLLLTLMSTITGCMLAFSAAILFRGMDPIHELENDPDFVLGITMEALEGFPFSPVREVKEETIFDYTLFTDEFITFVADYIGIEEEKIKRTYGCFAGIDDVKESVYFQLSEQEKAMVRKNAAFNPIYRTNYPIWDGSRAGYYGIGIIQVADDKFVKELSDYIAVQKLDADINTFCREEGVMLLHEHILSEETRNDATKLIGKNVYLYPVSVKYPEKNTYIEKADLIHCGYLDIEEKNFPDFERTWKGKDILYFLVSENTFSKLNMFPKQTFQISFHVNREREPVIREALKRIIKEENMKFRLQKRQNTDLFYLTCKSETIESKEDYLSASRLIMNAISMCLVILGIMNYINTMVTGIFERKNEFRLLLKIGMTQNQLYRMLVMEGLYYSFIIVIFFMTIGNVLLYSLGIIMLHKVPFFQFAYPGFEVGLITIVIFIITIILPVIVFRCKFQEELMKL